MPSRSLRLLILGVVTTLALFACSDGDGEPGMNMGDSSGSPVATGSEADIAFAQMMIPHHEQAVEMADLALERSNSEDVQDLASQIKGAQGPEIQRMTGWLDAWGAPMDMSQGDMGDKGGMSMSGTMSEDEMSALAKARGADFDRMWLQMMIAHHQGAVQMAEEVLAASDNNGEVTTLAQAVVDGQTAEIATMQQLLAEM